MADTKAPEANDVGTPEPDTTDQPQPDQPELDPEALRLQLLRDLWALTPENLRGKLPKPYKKDAAKGECAECGGYHGLPAIHLDYLGHADTCRLIAAKDILWSWEPKAGWDPETGEPRFVRNKQGYPIALWIDLTILGVTRPGVGTVTGGKDDPEKELIGDAIRNAAMRFGVGADMWSKAHHVEAADGDGNTGRTYDRGEPELTEDEWLTANGWMDREHHDDQRKVIAAAIANASPAAKTAFRAWFSDQGVPWAALWPKPFLDMVLARLRAVIKEHPHDDPEPSQPAEAPQEAQEPQEAAGGTDTPPAPETPADGPENAPGPGPMPWDGLPATLDPAQAIVDWVNAVPTRDLPQLCNDHGLPTSGTSKTLRARLAKALLESGWTPPPAE